MAVLLKMSTQAIITELAIHTLTIGIGASLGHGSLGGLLRRKNRLLWKRQPSGGPSASLLIGSWAKLRGFFSRLATLYPYCEVNMSVQMMNSTIQRFNAIRWHDSKLVGLCFYRAEGEERVKISLEMLGEGGALTPAEMIFGGSTYVALDVDLEGKRVCSDDISSAECYASSEWTKSLSEKSPYDSFEGYLHFQLYLIPPGGTINVLAKDFSLEMGAPG
jgi:hypothetical protein